ncbi:MAG: FAD-dependent oxidoreductase [Nocardioides sp.]
MPNELVDDVVAKIKLLGGRFVLNFVVGKTATLHDLREAGFWKIFVGTGAGLPRFMNVPGEHFNNVMSANEFLARVNLMQGLREDYETPLPETAGKQVLVIGGGNTAMDAARTARRLGGEVTIVYRRTQAEMPARVEELHHAVEEGVRVRELAAPYEFLGDDQHRVTTAMLDLMRLGEPDDSGRRRPEATGERRPCRRTWSSWRWATRSNPILKDSEPSLHTTKWGPSTSSSAGRRRPPCRVSSRAVTRPAAARRRSTPPGRPGGRSQQIVGLVDLPAPEIRRRVESAQAYTELGVRAHEITARRELAEGIVEMSVYPPGRHGGAAGPVRPAAGGPRR